jgi:hypothetical protein
MARFEQRITDQQVAAARKKIAAGASLRSAAAELPCAPSTLSDRIKKAEAGEADALARAGIVTGGGRRAKRTGKTLEGAAPNDVPGPVEVLRGALMALRANGQPDWPTRVTAARALAALRPDEVDPKAEQPPEPSIVVYDLPPGSIPVLHRAKSEEAKAPVEVTEPSPDKNQRDYFYVFFYRSDSGESELIGTWSPALSGRPDAVVTGSMPATSDADTAEYWRSELAAGRLPEISDDEGE